MVQKPLENHVKQPLGWHLLCLLYRLVTHQTALTQPATSPSYLSSTAWDSRSSRKTSLPPCQQEPASLLAVLVHSTEAGDFLLTTKHWQRPNRCEAARQGEKAVRERERSPRLCSWAHLWISVTPPRSPHLLLLLWPHRFLFGPASSCTRTNRLLQPHNPLRRWWPPLFHWNLPH